MKYNGIRIKTFTVHVVSNLKKLNLGNINLSLTLTQ